MTEALLKVRGVRKEYVAKAGSTLAVRDASFDIAAGEFVCIVGPSGCGKSTLLGIVAGLDSPSGGRVLLDDKPVSSPGTDRGMVFQRDCLFPWLTVRQNIEFASTLSRHRAIPSSTARARAETLLGEIGLARFADAYPRELSGGMRQRTAIARALVQRPRMLLMDEPFGALDAQTREQMQALLLKLCEIERTTVLFVTHDVEEATFLADRVLVMSAHPGELAHEIDVSLERPRAPELKLTPEFAAFRARVFTALMSVRREVAV